MRALIINPNSTESMTDSMVASASVAAPDVDFIGWTSRNGPPAIQGPEDGQAAMPALMDLVERVGPEIDCIIIGCFDDTGLKDANAISDCPVIGIGQAAFHMAALRAMRFSVVTTLSVSVPVIEENILGYGLAAHLGRVRASEIPVLETKDDTGAAAQQITATAKTAIAEDHCDCIILGCGGMSELTETVQEQLPIPVLDGVKAAARLCRAL